MRDKRPLQRSHGKYLMKPPEDLDYLIKIINSLSAVDSLVLRLMHPESLRALVEAEIGTKAHPSDLTFEVRLSLAAVENIRDFSPELRGYVERGEWKTGTVNNDLHAFQRYSQVWSAYHALHSIARVRREPTDRQRAFHFGETATSTVVYIDKEGIVRESKSLFSKAVEKQNIPAIRIRECPICTEVFWAGRSDAEQCGKAKCKSALSSKLKRNPRLREIYNLARRKKRKKLAKSKKWADSRRVNAESALHPTTLPSKGLKDAKER